MQFNTHVITTAIIDFDHGEVGPFLQNLGAETRAKGQQKTLGFISQDGSKYGSLDNVQSALKNEDFWIAIVILANATTSMNDAYANGSSDYDPKGGVLVYYEQGRNVLVLSEFAMPIINQFLSMFVLEFSKQKQQSLTRSNAGDVAALERQTALPIPIAFTLFNQAPATPSTSEAATEIGTICQYTFHLEISAG